MANLLGRLDVGILSSSSRLLSGRNNAHNQSSPQQHPKQQGLAMLRDPMEASIKSHGLQRFWSLERTRSSERTRSRIKTLIFSTRLGEGVPTLDSRIRDQEAASPSGIQSGSSGSATQLTVGPIELEKKIATDSATDVPHPRELRRQMERAMDMENGGAAAEDEHPYSHLKVAPKWREFQGEENWAGMLDPLNPVLRGEIIRYGEFAQAAYDAFDYDCNSLYCGTCKHDREQLLRSVGLEDRGYEVTEYLYATAGRDHPLARLLMKFDFDTTDKILPEDVWRQETNWIGYVAVCTDPKEIARLGRRDIVVVWRGTVTKLEWLENLRDYLQFLPTDFDPRRSGKGKLDLKVEAGFLTMYKTKNEASKPGKTKSARQQLLGALGEKKSAREQVLEAVKKLVHQYRFDDLSITVVGHSLGSALANLCAYDLAESTINMRLKPHRVDSVLVPEWEDREGLAPQLGELADRKMHEKLGPIPITVFSFAGPRVGNDAFRDRMEELGVKVLRVVNKNDKVPQIPGVIFNESLQFLEDKLKPVWKWLDSLPWTYSHCGVRLELDNVRSPFLKYSKDAVDAHNLQAYLHLVAMDGYHGPGRELKPDSVRDITLVNQASNYLKTRHFIPAHLFREENRDLMLTNGDKWVSRLGDTEDIPEHDIRSQS